MACWNLPLAKPCGKARGYHYHCGTRSTPITVCRTASAPDASSARTVVLVYSTTRSTQVPYFRITPGRLSIGSALACLTLAATGTT